jgi:predicted ATPase
LLQLLPGTPEQSQQELQLQLTLAGPLTATKGYTAPEVERASTRALELCRQLGETPELFWALLRLWMFYLPRAEHKTARELAEQGLSLAQNVHNPISLVWAHFMLGATLLYSGEFTLAREHLEEVIALYDLQQHRSYGSLLDPGESCLSYAAWGLWFLGYPDQALQRSQEALTLAQELSHPFSVAHALNYAAVLYQLRREGYAAQKQTEVGIVLAAEQGFPHWLALGTSWQGWALAEQGEAEKGIVQIRQGLAAVRAMGAELAGPTYLALLAEAYGKVGEAEQGLGAIVDALAQVEQTGERWYEAELYRLKGELTLAQSKVQSLKSKVTDPRPLAPDPQGEAEACFLTAIEIAQKQQAKSLELRAATSLARLWQQPGKREEAHQMLSEIYGWFTEGFDTKDLQEAQALLGELS